MSAVKQRDGATAMAVVGIALNDSILTEDISQVLYREDYVPRPIAVAEFYRHGGRARRDVEVLIVDEEAARLVEPIQPDERGGPSLVLLLDTVDLDAAINALRNYAEDVVVRPVAPARLVAAVDRAARQHRKLSVGRQQRERTLKALQDLAGDAASAVQVIEELGDVGVVAPAQPPSAGFRSSDLGEPPDAPETVIRWIMRLKTLRRRYFVDEPLDDAMWDMLLHLAMARLSGSKISVSDLGITVGVPDTTALRKIGELEAAGLVRRAPDPNDRRRSNLELVDGAFERLRSYLVDAAKL